jgi:flagellin
MSVNSILTNSSALSALQSLNMTESNLAITQNQVSSGLAVANASQNAAYWSIGQQLSSDSGIVTSANSALAQSQAVFDTATSAINSVMTTIQSIQTAVTEAKNPGADIANINTTLASLSAQLTDAVNGASFNGTNVLNGSILTTVSAPMSFVSGFDASATGGTVSTIDFQTQALTGGAGAGVTTTVTGPNVTDVTTLASLAKLAVTDTTLTSTLAYGTDQVANSTTNLDATGDTFSVTSMALDGTTTVTKYTGVDVNGDPTSITLAGTPTNQAAIDIANTANAAALAAVPPTATVVVPAAIGSGGSFSVSVETIPPASATAGILTQGAFDLTSLGGSTGTQVSSANAAAMLTAVGAAFQAVTNYSATIGATQDRMTAASTLNGALTTNYAIGVSALVDADMNVASTRLQALQTQQQLGIQSLSIANQNSQLILKLFNG